MARLGNELADRGIRIRLGIKMRMGGKECFRRLKMVKQGLEQAVSHHGD